MVKNYRRGDKGDVLLDNDEYILILNGREVVRSNSRIICEMAKRCYIKNDMSPLERLQSDNTMVLSNYNLEYVYNLDDKGDVSGRIKQYEEKDIEIKRVIKHMRDMLIFG